jgi:ATP-dependent Lon protease
VADSYDFTRRNDPPNTLPVLALRQGALLPGAVVQFNIGRKRSLSALDAAVQDLILVASPRDPTSSPDPADLLQVATLARVVKRQKPPKQGPHRVMLQGLSRVKLTGWPSTQPHLLAAFEPIEHQWPQTVEADALASEFRRTVEETVTIVGNEALVAAQLNDLPTIDLLVDGVAQYLQEPEEWRREILVTLEPLIRAEKVLKRLIRAKEVVAAQKSIRET